MTKVSAVSHSRANSSQSHFKGLPVTSENVGHYAVKYIFVKPCKNVKCVCSTQGSKILKLANGHLGFQKFSKGHFQTL